MVIVEGPDGAGKTTLVNHLCEKFGMKVGSRGVANRDELYKVTRQDTYRALATAVRGHEHPLIWDRLFVSEFVYADIVGRECEFKDTEKAFIVDVLNALGCPVIGCLPPFEVVQKNAAGKHQMAGVNEGLGKIYMRYDEGDLPWPNVTMWYDYTGAHGSDFASLEEVEAEISGYIEERKDRQAWAFHS